MSEKWLKSEISIVINDKSQGSIAKHLSCIYIYKYIIQFAGERTFELGKHLAKLQAK